MKHLKAVQIIGTQRSGSNLLRVMLDSLDGVFAPHPPHLIQRFLPLLPLYGSLTIKKNREQLINDMCEMVRLNPVAWENVRLDKAEIAAQCQHFSLYEVFRIIYETGAKQTKAHTWINKSMQNIHYAHEMEASGIHPFYIYLYRDGRDVALSFKKAIVGEKHIYSIAQCWQRDQAACLQLQSKIEPSRFIAIRYEDIIEHAEIELKKLCRFLDIEYNPQAMEYYKSKESDHTSAAGKMWENVKRPILRNNKNKFMHELTSEEIAIFETVAGKELKALGYEPITPPEKIQPFTQAQISTFEKQNEKLKMEFSQQADPVDIQKRQPQVKLLNEIKERIRT